MATLTTITTGMEKGPEAIDANDKALNADIATLLNGEKLTWIDLPLSTGITGGLQMAQAFNSSVIFLKGQVGGTFKSGQTLSTCAGTALQSMHWADQPVVTSTGIASLQTNGSGELTIQGCSGTPTQINPSGVFLK
jgi:hypothetical protein